MKHWMVLGAAWLAWMGAGSGQTTIDLRTQSRDVDFSEAGFTKPFKAGTMLPAGCSAGETFFKTDAAPGRNLYLCSPANVWTQSSGGTAELPASLVRSDGSNTYISGFQDFGGAGATRPAKTGTALPGACQAGEAFFKTDAPAGENLYVCGSSNTWTQVLTPGTVVRTGQSNAFSAGTQDFSGAGATKPVKTGTALPPTCGAGEVFFKTDATAGDNLFVCGSANQWTQALSPAGLVRRNASNAYTGGMQDFGGAGATRPAKTGAALPAACEAGEVFFRTDAPAGQNLYLCGAANAWTQLISGAASIPATVVKSDQGNAYTAGLQDFRGAGATMPAKTGIQPPATCEPGEMFFRTDAPAGDNLYLCGGANAWTQLVSGAGSLPATVAKTDQGNTYTAGTQDFSGAGATKPAKAGTTLPATCAVGEQFFKTDAAAGQNLFLCGAANTWTQMISGAGGLPSTVAKTDQGNTYTAGMQDLSGAGATKPVKTGTSVPAVCSVGEVFFKTDALAGENLFVCTGENSWTALLNPTSVARTDRANTFGAGMQDFGAAGATRPAKTGTTIPATCSAGEVFFKTDAAAGENLYVCGGQNQWAQALSPAGIVRRDRSNAFTGGTQDFSGAGATKPAKTGSALPASCTVGEQFFRTDVAAGQNLYLCTSANTWSQLIGGGGGAAPASGAYNLNYSQTFDGRSSVTLAHNLGTPNVIVACYDSADQEIDPVSKMVSTTAPYEATVTFGSAKSGRCVVNGSGGWGGWANPADLQVQSTAAVITLRSGGITVDNNPVLWSDEPAIIRTGGTDTGTFRVFVDYNAGNPVRRCMAGPGIAMGNYTVTGFAGSACESGEAFPENSKPLATVNVAAGSFQAPLDMRTLHGMSAYEAGSGLIRTGRVFSLNTAATGAALVSGSNTFVAGTVQTFAGALVAAGSERTAPAKTGTALPAACAVGDQFFRTDTTAGQNLFFCTPANTWTQMFASGGEPGNVARTDQSNTFTAGVQDFSGAAATKPAKAGASDPAVCGEGELFYNTAQHTLKQCTGSNTWTSIGGGGGVTGMTSYVTLPAAACQGESASTGFDLGGSPPTPVCVTGSDARFGALRFADEDGARSIEFHFPLPPDWTGAVDVSNVRWRTPVTSGSVAWLVQAGCAAEGSMGDPVLAPAQALADAAKGTANQLNDASLDGLNTTGCTPGAEMFVRLSRDRGHASDTLAGPAELIHVQLRLRRAQ